MPGLKYHRFAARLFVLSRLIKKADSEVRNLIVGQPIRNKSIEIFESKKCRQACIVR
jgi:hypothetical protein